ncbi:hypothetical protein PS357_08100 [Acinetobacter nosocomialis]|uniref:hypothetical protein n=1 Tax=Acinetobacter nosocomialis TaxID=106654 RepID=UPI002361F5B7|nr:hypothetical protein [Acinetobacter nosocomialis]MDC9815707.1 hypothetical protein [Acinetobacter nosocomialis]MDE9404929.1 hypothetical protein [Acinetobacter nosocomialis]HDG9761585.1 hypothetical protein [Acinetobacter nosocomialis]
MVQPINYMLDVANPVQTTLQGFNGGLQLGVAYADHQRALKIAQQDRLEKQQMKDDLSNLASNPSPEGYTKLMTKYPQLSENLKRAYDTMDDGQRKNTLSLASQSYAALANNQPDIAKQVLGDAATAYENSGNKKDAGVLRGYVKMIENNPSAARTSIGMLMASTNPDKFAEIYGKLGDEQRANEMQPYDIAESKAKTAYTEAQTNDIPLAAEDRRTGVENQYKKIEYDNQYNYDKLSQDQQQFYDDLSQKERLEATKLKATKAETPVQRVERLEKVENYANAAKQAADASNLAARLTQQAKENSGAYWDRLVRQVPGTSENTFAKDIETLKSQVFLAQVEKMRGLGALTDKEGDAIRSSIASLDINQGPAAVQMNLSKIAQQMSAAAKSANRKAQLYATKGQGYSPAVTEAAKTLGISPAEAQKFVNENGL